MRQRTEYGWKGTLKSLGVAAAIGAAVSVGLLRTLTGGGPEENIIYYRVPNDTNLMAISQGCPYNPNDALSRHMELNPGIKPYGNLRGMALQVDERCVE